MTTFGEFLIELAIVIQGGAIGIAVGATVAWIADYRDRRLRRARAWCSFYSHAWTKGLTTTEIDNWLRERMARYDEMMAQ